MVSMIPAIATTNGQQMFDILALLNSAFEQNLVSGLAFLRQSQADMIRTIVNTTTNFIIVGIIHDFIQLNYHWKLRYQSSFILTNKIHLLIEFILGKSEFLINMIVSRRANAKC